jgi:hypothetical protein
MQTYRGSALALMLAVVVLALSSSTSAVAASGLPSPQNLRNVSSDPQTVTLLWAPGSGKSVHILQRYIIRRDGRTIDKLEAVSGVAPLTYTDTPDDGTHRYSVIAQYVGEGNSRPAAVSVDVNTPKAPPADNSRDSSTTAGYCNDVKTRNLVGNNQPTPFELYGCTPPMTQMPDKYSSGISLIGHPKDVSRQIQSGYLNDVISYGTFWHLLASSVLSWALDAKAYNGLSGFGAKMVNGIQASPGFPVWVKFGSSLFLFGMLAWMIRGHLGRAVRAIAIGAFAVFALSALLVAPLKFIKYTTQPALYISNHAVGAVSGFTIGTPEAANFNFTVRPTYYGDPQINELRKAINRRWVVERYYPMCTKVFGDFRFATQQRMPGSQTTWCEGWLKSQLTGSDKAVETYESALEKANPTAYKFYGGSDISKRTVYTVVQEISSWLNNLYLLFYLIVIMAAMYLLVFDVIAAVLILPMATSALPAMVSLTLRRLRAIGGKWENAGIAGLGILLMMSGEMLFFNLLAALGPLPQAAVLDIYALVVFCAVACVWWSRRRKRKEDHRALGGSTPIDNAISRASRIAGTVALQGASFGAGAEAVHWLHHSEDSGPLRTLGVPPSAPSPATAQGSSPDWVDGSAVAIEDRPQVGSGSQQRHLPPPPPAPPSPPSEPPSPSGGGGYRPAPPPFNGGAFADAEVLDGEVVPDVGTPMRNASVGRANGKAMPTAPLELGPGPKPDAVSQDGGWRPPPRVDFDTT